MVKKKRTRRRVFKVFVEGAKAGRADLNTACRAGFTALLEKAGMGRRMPRIQPCGSRQLAFKAFCNALEKAGQDDVFLLLVDSEAMVTAQDPWEHVRQRKGDGWEVPSGATAEHLHLMVQMMESWFLADADALARHFGKNFRREALPSRPDIEVILKKDVEAGLEAATKATSFGAYRKDEPGTAEKSFELLAEIDPKRLEQFPWARRFFDAVRRGGGAA